MWITRLPPLLSDNAELYSELSLHKFGDPTDLYMWVRVLLEEKRKVLWEVLLLLPHSISLYTF